MTQGGRSRRRNPRPATHRRAKRRPLRAAVTLDAGESAKVDARPTPDVGADQPVPENSVGDLTRLLVLINELQKVRALTTSELEALSYLVGTERTPDGVAKWPALRFAYRYRFSPTPGSDQLYDDLLRLENAALVKRRSPIEVTERGLEWLKDPRYGEALEEIRAQARAAAETYARATNLVERTIERGGEVLARDATPTRTAAGR